MNTLVKDKYKTIDRIKNKESLFRLQTIFNEKFKEIEQFKENQSSEEFKKRFDELVHINHQIEHYSVW
ncbi:MAG: hypothetical protein NKF70_00280 [Methanobacterium sp. ERen5]|nr:MAG: hypothetical protein NKF70_00280 [Methanobacterium sp. ERen5]